MKKSVSHLKKLAPFRKLIAQYGLPSFGSEEAPFEALARAIVYQQISGKAAASIFKKFVALFGMDTDSSDWESKSAHMFPSPESVLAMDVSRMRAAGLSAQKVDYIKDLAQKFSDGSIEHTRLHTLSNEDIIATLTQIKGIGVWTVHMFLIFKLQRPDVLPTGDLGIKKGFQILFKLRSIPSHSKMEEIAKDWRTHASLASWYLWRVADAAKEPQKSRRKKLPPRAGLQARRPPRSRQS